MYQPYPVSAPVSQEPARLDPPRSVVLAVRLMYPGAAAELVKGTVDILTTKSLQASVKRQYPHYTALQLDHAKDGRLVFLVLASLIAAGLWLWMARANGRGLSWARTVSAVFFGIAVLELLFERATVYTVWGLAADGAICLIGLVVVVLLFRKESGPFYRQPARLTPQP